MGKKCVGPYDEVETIGIWSSVPGAWDHSVYPELVPIVISNLIHADGNVTKLKYFCYDTL